MFGGALEGLAYGQALAAPAEVMANARDARAVARSMQKWLDYQARMEQAVRDWRVKEAGLVEEVDFQRGSSSNNFLNAEARRVIIEEMIRRGALSADEAQKMESAARAQMEQKHQIDANNVKVAREIKVSRIAKTQG